MVSAKENVKVDQSRERYIKVNERYADNIVYNKVSAINVNVSEVKKSEEDHTIKSQNQNNEQMLGLWRPLQQVMLGLELYGTSARPKVLLLKEEKMMCYLKKSI